MSEAPLAFLAAGGDMGARIRAMDWSKTPLGPPAEWPENLKTCVRIILTSRQPMFVWWGDQLVNLYNDAYKSIVGGKHPHVLGRPASEVWAEIWDQVGPRAMQTLRGDEGTYDEALLLIMERNGYPEETYYTFSYSPVANERGGTGGIICANTDDTRRIISERQLSLVRELATRTTEARRSEVAAARAAEALATNARDLPFSLVYLIDADKSRATLEGAAGIDRGHRAAPETISLDHEEDWPIGAAIRSGEPQIVENLGERFGALPKGAWGVPSSRGVVVPITAAGASGRAGALVVGLSPFRLFDDEYRGFLQLVAGQTGASIANAHAYEEEKRRAESLAELDRAKTAFFSNVSHEFRTPLTLMLGPTEDALANGTLSGENLHTVHRNALRLHKLVNALLDFARIEAGRTQASYQPTDLAALTADLASAFRSAITRAGLAFEVDCMPLPEPIFVDHDMWEKIVLNLLSNAFKFTFEGKIRVALAWRGDRAELTIQDTGTGIPESALAHLFERFHRVEGARARTQEGSGIGLALVHELVRLHDGSIRVESKEGEGTTFVIALRRGSAHLPSARVAATRTLSSTATGAAPYVEEAMRWLPDALTPASPEVAPTDAHARENAAIAEPTSVASGGKRARVLVADDNADMREYVTRLLQPRWSIEAVVDGQAALESVRRSRPDLILSDVMMPRMDGFALLHALREDESTRSIPVIMLSARAGDEARVEGLEAGVDDYLVKPFSARELVARVQTHLQIAALRREAENERQKLAEFLQRAPIPVAVLRGSDLEIDVVNASFAEIAGRDDLRGRSLRGVFPDDGPHGLVNLAERAFETSAEAHAVETPLMLQRDGIPVKAIFNLIARPVRDPAGLLECVMLVAIDVTEQVHARQRVDGLRAAAEQASRAKDDFLSTLSHELRTPLNAIVGWSTLARGGSVGPDRIPRVLETIERNARMQARLIDDMLDLARIEQGKLVLSVGPVEMVRVVEQALESARPAAEAKGVRLQQVLDSHATIVGDADRLQQVVWNLLTNAIKFTPRGGRVQVRLHRADSHVELEVADDGQGIDPDFLPHVFDRFRQADPSITRKVGGLGLGLAIVRSLVELHGGVVFAKSEGKDKGALFVVRVPTAPLRSDAAKRTTPLPNVPAQVTFESPPELRELRVLVVDDEPDTRALVDYVISQCEARVTTAGGVSDALKLLAEQDFDVIVSDIGMPDEDGHSFIRKVRASAANRNARVPALALTAYARAEDRTAAFKAGFDMHLAKPIEPSELVAVIARLVSRSHGGSLRN